MSNERMLLSRVCEALIKGQKIDSGLKEKIFTELGLGGLLLKCLRCSKTFEFSETSRVTDMRCFRKEGRLVIENTMPCECGGLMYGTENEVFH